MCRQQLRKELHELWATRKVLITLVVMLVFGMIAPISAKILPDILDSVGERQQVQIILPEPTTKDALDQFVKNTQQIIMFVVLVLSFGAVVGERERGFMTIIFPHGLSRVAFVLAKFVALAILLGVGMIISALATYFYTAVLFDPPHASNFTGIILLLYMYLMMFLAIGILGSTLGQNMTGAAGITFGLVVPILLMSLFIPFAPTKLIEWSAALAAGNTASTQWGAFFCSMGIMLGAIILSCIAIERQEIISGSAA